MTRSSFPSHRALAQSHPKKYQDSCIHLLRLHENEAQILWRKRNQAWKTHTNPTLPNTQGTSMDSIGIPKRENFRIQPQNPLKPHRVESLEQGWNNMDTMRIHGNKTWPPRCRVGANFRLGSAAPNTLQIPKGGAALQRDLRHIPDTTIPNARIRFHIQGAEF